MKEIVGVLREFHSSGYIHRDIKEDNIRYKDGRFYLIDFGISAKYLQDDKITHIPFSMGKLLRGTPLTASTFSHMGLEHGRRDDLISLMYTFLYISDRERLPWLDKIKKEGASPMECYYDAYMIKSRISEDQFHRDFQKRLVKIAKILEGLRFD